MENVFLTQCACVLFDGVPALDALEVALAGWDLSDRQAAAPGEHGWTVAGRGFLISLRGSGVAVVDVVPRPWPDDPSEARAHPSLGAAWRAGLFGSFAEPGALVRAKQQDGLWPEARTVADRHRAFVRLRTGYRATAGGEPAPPADHDALHELLTLTELADALMGIPGALAFFVPAGEALRSRDHVREVLTRKVGVAAPPLELWTNTRGVRLDAETDPRWLLLDVVGMAQLELPDQEALFAEGSEAPENVEALLRNACLHLLAGRPIPPGTTADDRGGHRWRAGVAEAVLGPRRQVLRWQPEAGPRPGDEILPRRSKAEPRSPDDVSNSP
jgi:hypothetical protein